MSITITEVRNARSLQADNQRFDLEINHPEFGWIGYHLSPDDTDMTVDNSALLKLIGSNFSAYVPPTQEELDTANAAGARRTRDYMLKHEVDPIVSNPLRWADLGADKQAQWSQYRTDLLNVPQQESFPNSISWPTKPE